LEDEKEPEGFFELPFNPEGVVEEGGEADLRLGPRRSETAEKQQTSRTSRTQDASSNFIEMGDYSTKTLK
jgi:hypothetical protein